MSLKNEFYIPMNILNNQLVKYFMDIDICPISIKYKGIKGLLETNRSFSQLTPTIDQAILKKV